jgi:hypothetical protein
MDEVWEEEAAGKHGPVTMRYPIDGDTLTLLRKEVDARGSWGWYVWNKDSISCERTHSTVPLPETRPHKFSKQASQKDVIYQKWRTKYNNENVMHSEEGKEKKRLSRLKICTTRRMFQSRKSLVSGETVNEFGTLVGISTVNRIPAQNYNELQQLVAKMKSISPNVRKDYATELVRLWETFYAGYNGISQKELTERFKTNSLTTVSHYMYYEAYATKICQLPVGAAQKLAYSLSQIASVMPKIFERRGKDVKLWFNPFTPASTYAEIPLICTLVEISHFFQESTKLFMRFSVKNPNCSNELLEQVWDNGLANVIFEAMDASGSNNPRRFGVASQGVPFISKLTEQEAVFVFATSADVFGFRPDRERQQKDKRINCVTEFLRRSCLCIEDSTLTPGLAEIKE